MHRDCGFDAEEPQGPAESWFGLSYNRIYHLPRKAQAKEQKL